jgi:hypothetical protein
MKDSQKHTCCDISLIHQDEFHDFCRNGNPFSFIRNDAKKQDRLFQQIYEDISKNLVPVRPDRHYHRTKGQLAGKYSNTHKRAY